ncbi:hypothetical protein D9758_003001 [Tetrapyrgos nigripes]|uniref:Uncharacterized protein n=1 Tax=Tetrapyrgos nigripes TaxID=182062 RepID=A0A8H5GQD7_9AGAR|nr:hypothetical protein D9758_003001 [Tetrapyrgos nigripes]
MPTYEESESLVPLLQSEDVDPSGFQSREDIEEASPLVSAKSLSYYFQRIWKSHRRKRVVVLAALSAAFIIIIIILSIAFRGAATIPEPEEVEEEFAKDPRLEKYQTLNDTLLCGDWTTPDVRSPISTVSFNLYSSVNLTFFLTRGNPINGQIIIHPERLESPDHIRVDITAKHNDLGRKQLQLSKACLAGQDNEHGIMIWADPQTTFSDVTYEIRVHLPDIRDFHDISTDFTNSAVLHDFTVPLDLFSPTSFDILRIATRNAKITGELFSSQIYIHTTNAEVKGIFAASDVIQIQTSKAPAYITVITVAKHAEAETSVSIRNKDAAIIVADISILSRFDHATLNASVHTTNGNLIINGHSRIDMPDKAIFLLNASTSNAPASLHLPKEFQGTFNMSTTSGTASLKLNSDQRDRDGQKRVVSMDIANAKAHKAGKLYWGGEPPESDQGDVKLKTSKKDVTISGVHPGNDR